ncbi:hypothetical protein SAMN05421858_0576 [Haladaptatus litoreus]|uniref:Uncharacterized protein n=1 Tax=Haladaptatus litoreus TaxID=553468 RepID=A0A1N6W2L9_9EURY|nr:hypothetical protein [Haladaptatus litoreus]SIQ84245.1 hypothetical protein SAMN05421858_0576 [Haladaptatus litoreus]
MFGNNDARLISDGGKNGEAGTGDGTEATGSENTDHTTEDSYRFRLGGLSLDLSGVEADIDGLTLGLDAIELGVSKTGDSNAEESGSRLRGVRESTPRNGRGRVGARVGAFVGRLVGGLVEHLAEYGFRLLLDEVRARLRKSEREDESAEPSAAGESDGATTDSKGSNEELITKLERAMERD